jgi:hypothetical protein
VTPVSTVAPTTGSAVTSLPVSVSAAAGAPVASSVTISGTPTVGQTLTGHYTYSDPQSDPEGVSLFAWLRNGVAISGATASTYLLVSADGGTSVSFQVTPVSTVAPTTGSPVTSTSVLVSAGTGPTNYFLDNFNDADATFLENHTPDTGGSWVRLQGAGGSGIETQSNDAVLSGSSYSIYIYHTSVAPPTPDYTITAPMYWSSNPDYSRLILVGRLLDATNYYSAGFARDTGNWYINKTVGGVDTGLSQVAGSFPAGPAKVVKLIFAGSTIKLNADGVDVLSVTDSDLTAAGYPGLWGQASNYYYWQAMYASSYSVDSNS